MSRGRILRDSCERTIVADTRPNLFWLVALHDRRGLERARAWGAELASKVEAPAR
jgi:hypothetical protein